MKLNTAQLIAFIEMESAKLLADEVRKVNESYATIGIANHRREYQEGVLSLKNQLLKRLKSGEEHE